MTELKHAHRLRTGRYSEPGQIYLLTAVVLNRQPLFHDFKSGRLVVDALKTAEQEGFATSLAWVVMPDHFHWLIELQNIQLPSLMARTKSRIAVTLNRSAGRQGPVWQHGYHDRAIRKEEDLQAVARYIVANPLRAGLVERVGDYPLWDAIWL
ncbi:MULTISPECIES: REP-associated tyrosine transposase [Pseudomonas]|jgi:putative transposase|uniref:Transposase n=3 Tax=Pseudomonas TaxID=286 RepID=A0AB36D3Q0_9PSED|nr:MULTISPECIES: transposase [Pseudomonas]MBU0522155.1 transposase [Gammaproteobacteria bacterium]MBU0842317.1 transposase [Gammaproteobacteria bacterium]MBU1839267.1 transposase [Gammaproteobacteria bacterium]MDO8403942.1 transposase [Pseudomonas sp.]MSU95246.1 transposase [Pseudomonas mandelii]